jgi:hypothetical protein
MGNWKNVEDIQVGDLATEGMGSDSYGRKVTKVERFKTGARKGQVKYVWAGELIARKRDFVLVIHDGDNGDFYEADYGAARRFTAKLVKVCRHIKRCECNRGFDVRLEGSGWYNQLHVGEAINYSDPSF